MKPPNSPVTPYSALSNPLLSVLVRVHRISAGPVSRIENVCPQSDAQSLGRGSAGDPDRSMIVQVMSDSIPASCPTEHWMFSEGVSKVQTSARTEFVESPRTSPATRMHALPDGVVV